MNYFESITSKRKIGTIIKVKRKNERLTQSELAVKINCDQSVISRMELGNDSIDIDLYKLALNYFGSYYHDEISLEFLNNLFCELWNAYEFIQYKDLSKFETMIKQLKNKDLDVITKSHLDVLVYFYHYLNRNLAVCDEIDQHLKDTVYICMDQYQMLYLVTKLNVLLLKNNMEEAKEIVSILMNEKKLSQYQDFINFFRVLYYYHINKVTMCLKYALINLEYFKSKNNIKRFFLIEIMVVSFIVKERNYNMAITRYKQLLQYKEYLNEKDMHAIYFRIGYCYYSLKNYDEAIIHFNNALRFNNSDDNQIYNLFLTISNVNHIYYYLLNIYDMKDDLKNYKTILSKINYTNENCFGTKIINLYFQKRLNKSEKYYNYIEKEIVPSLYNLYEKIEMTPYLIELLNYYYDTQQYTKYHDLSKKIYDNLA